jgi:hypothetical protein
MHLHGMNGFIPHWYLHNPLKMVDPDLWGHLLLEVQEPKL